MKANSVLKYTFLITLLLCSCNKPKDKILHNSDGLSGHLEQIVTCFVEQYKISENSNIYISEQSPTIEDRNPALKRSISEYMYISMVVYTPSNIRPNRILYTTETDNYTLFYDMDKGRKMAISNNLIWKKMNLPEREKHNAKEFPIIIDYIETHFLYNKEENTIEISDFKSEYCKGRIEWEENVEIEFSEE